MSVEHEQLTEAEGRLWASGHPADRGFAVDDLLPLQRDAVTHSGGPLVVLGAAGTGKTRVISERFSWLVSQGSRPERIAVLVPSVARADALRTQLEGALNRGYEELFVVTPTQLAAVILGGTGPASDTVEAALAPGDRLAMLVERIDELSLQRHDFGGNANALLGGFVRRIDRLKAELVGPDDYARWASYLEAGESDPSEAAIAHEFAEVYRTHERILAEAGARDDGDLVRDALRRVREQPGVAKRFEHVLIDDAQELDLGPASLALEVAGTGLTAAGDPAHALRRLRGAGAQRMRSFAVNGAREITLERSVRCPEPILRVAQSVVDFDAQAAAGDGKVAFWRCANDRAQAQSVAADIERLTAREGVAPGQIVVLVPAISREGQAVA
ncbi:MAG TPA: ATP-dependent helicase, partial [Solirubrobacteraceae bacterium]|nr:ATP-dependent helicase [Solirubrobacteraceae bacterium]